MRLDEISQITPKEPVTEIPCYVWKLDAKLLISRVILDPVRLWSDVCRCLKYNRFERNCNEPFTALLARIVLNLSFRDNGFEGDLVVFCIFRAVDRGSPYARATMNS